MNYIKPAPIKTRRAHYLSPRLRILARLFLGGILALIGAVAVASPIDQQYSDYSALLAKHVKWLPGEKASQVDYTALGKEQAELKEILASWSELTQAEFDQMSRDQQMAFLINAYNGFTLELILTQYPDLKSIKDLGGLFSSPWRKKFFTLLGKKRTLDWIEHEQLRPVYKDPRVHAAVNCASIGCPALLNAAYTADQLDNQLESGMQRFLADSSRNRIKNGKYEVSMIFKWFAEDFESGFKGSKMVVDFLALYSEQLDPAGKFTQAIASKTLGVTYLEYDWALNDLKK